MIVSKNVECRVVVRATEDIRIAECGWAFLYRRRRRWHRGVRQDCLLGCGAPIVDRGAIISVADIVPYGGSVLVRRNSVHVVAKELEPQVILARRSRVALLATIQLRESARHAAAIDVGVLHNADQSARTGRIVPERSRERVVD